MPHDPALGEETLRLGWLLRPDPVDELLLHLARTAGGLRKAGVYEADTRAIFVEPILRGLGWDTLDHDSVDRERSGLPDPDYWLTANGYLLAAIEVKALRDGAESSPKRKDDDQLAKYIAAAHIAAKEMRLSIPAKKGANLLRGVLTDGDHWIVRQFRGGSPDPDFADCDFSLTQFRDAPLPPKVASGLVASLARPNVIAGLLS